MIESVKPSYSPTPTRTTPDRQANDGLDQRMHWSVDYVEPGANVWSSAGSLRVARHLCCIVETNWTVTRFRVRPLPIQLEVFFSSRPTQLPQTSHANPRTEAQKCFSSYCYSE